MHPRLTIQPAARDATLATVLLLAAVWAGSDGFADVDRALLGYLAATLVATFGTVLRARSCRDCVRRRGSARRSPRPVAT